MQGNVLKFAKIFKRSSSSGCIRMGEDRYILLSADALGSMRRELIENLGWEVAQGILWRVGYQSGRNDAGRLKDLAVWESDADWLRAGPQLHFLEGIVKASVEELDLDRSRGVFHMKGAWIGSYEADQHLKFYGIGTRTACWTLEGYATGYASEFFGSEIVCIETGCRGKGDDVCSYELRPAREWGPAAVRIKDMLSTKHFADRFDRCLRSINAMGCELEHTSLDAIITTSADGMIASCSEAANDLLGVLPGEALGRSIASFYSGGEREERQLTQQLVSEGRIRNYFTVIVTPAGLKKPIALSSSLIRDTDARIVGTISVAHNLSEIRRLEDELSTKNRFMANILQDSADAIITMDPNNVITSWNKGVEAIFGYNAREMIGKPLNILVPQELRDAQELKGLAEKMHLHGAIRSHQTERITKDGRRIQVIFTRTAIRDDSGRVIGSSAVLKDVTTYRNLERQLADAEHLATLGELSAGLAHEIKNPLAGIKGAIDVIRDSLPAADMHREVLGDVLYEVNRIDKIVRDLLNYAKPKPPMHKDIHVSQMAHRIVAMVRQSLKNDSLSIDTSESGIIPDFTGDETQLEQVLLNLLLNAQNAMPRGGNIRVLLSYDKDEAALRMEVIDNGPGIPDEIRKKIFQPFFTTRTDGIGLGLATCLKNVQYHGGTIEVQSDPGRGTRFIITIPMLSRI